MYNRRFKTISAELSSNKRKNKVTKEVLIPVNILNTVKKAYDPSGISHDENEKFCCLTLTSIFIYCLCNYFFVLFNTSTRELFLSTGGGGGLNREGGILKNLTSKRGQKGDSLERRPTREPDKPGSCDLMDHSHVAAMLSPERIQTFFGPSEIVLNFLLIPDWKNLSVYMQNGHCMKRVYDRPVTN